MVDKAVSPSGDLSARRIQPAIVPHFRRAHAAGGKCRSADADAGGVHRFALVVRDHVLVHRDAGLVERRFGKFAADAQRGDIDEHQMIIGAAAHQPQAAGHQCLGQRFGVVDDALRVLFEFGPQRLAEANRFAGDHVHQRATLHAGEHAAVQILGVFGLAHRYSGARAAERFVRGGGDEIGDWHRVVVQAGGDQAGVVGHIDEQFRADLTGDFSKLAVRNLPRIGAGAGDDQLRFVLAGQAGHLIEIDAMRVAGHAVRDEVIKDAGDVQLHAVRQMSAVGEVEAQHRVARLNGRQDKLRNSPGCRSAAAH